MNIEFEQLGVIKKGEINLNDLTLLCGPNNTGKTYVMYSLYGLLDKDFEVNFDFIQEIVYKLAQKNVYKLDLHDIMAQHFDSMIDIMEDSFHKRLPNLFSVKDSEFANTKIKLRFDKDALLQDAIKKEWKTKLSLGKEKDWFLYIEKAANQTMLSLTFRQKAEIPDEILITLISSHIVKLIFSNISRSSFLLPAERTGMNLFFKELSSIRNRLLHHVQKDNINPLEILQDIMDSRYAEPISDYIEFLNRLSDIKKRKGKFSAIAQYIENKIITGKYEIDSNEEIYFLPSGNKKMQLHFSSSTVKTIFGLVFYLNHLAQKGDCLMIDEPELNLHPDNQRIIARVLVQLVNAGLKVVVSTHSAYFVRELNNLIMLNQSFSQVDMLRQRYGYMQKDVLNSNRVSAYLFDNQTITLMKLEPNEGIIADTFDQTINNLNQSSNDIYYAIQEELEKSEDSND